MTTFFMVLGIIVGVVVASLIIAIRAAYNKTVNILNIQACISVAIVCAVLAVFQKASNSAEIIVFSLIGYIASFAWIYRKELLKPIDQLALVQVAALLIYIILSSFHLSFIFQVLCIGVVLIPVFVLLVHDSFSNELPAGWKKFLFLTYLYEQMLLLLVYVLIEFVFNSSFLSGENLSAVQVLFIGFNVFYLGTNLVYFSVIGGFEDKEFGLTKKRTKQFSEYAMSLVYDRSLVSFPALLVIGIDIVLIALNLTYTFLPHFWFINVFLLTPFIIQMILSR